MREIKFRVWSYGRMNYFDNPKNGLLYSCGEMSLSSGYDSEDNPTFYGTPEFTLMQFTGLKDKNGREIYEGDVLKVVEVHNKKTSEYLTPVIFEDCAFVVQSGRPVYDTFLSAWAGDPNETYPLFEITVVGNIHENPELFK